MPYVCHVLVFFQSLTKACRELKIMINLTNQSIELNVPNAKNYVEVPAGCLNYTKAARSLLRYPINTLELYHFKIDNFV